jgi:Zn-dependent peptidase ImmA (M78 family)
MPYELIKVATQNNIRVEFWNFDWPLEAIYYDEKRPWILLSKELFSDRAHFRSVLAEELGHHFTSAGDRIIRADADYQDVLEIGRQEYRAKVWAARFLMSVEDLERAFCRGLKHDWELAEYFCVDKQLINVRMMVYFDRERQGA